MSRVRAANRRVSGVPGARPPERGLDALQGGEQGPRRERRLDRHDAIEEPALLARRPAGLGLPRLGVVEPRCLDEPDRLDRVQPPHRGFEGGEPVALVRAERQIDARHDRLRVSSTEGVPTRPSIGGVSLRTRTRISRAGNSRRRASMIRPGQALDQVHAILGADLDDPPGHQAVVDRRRHLVGHDRRREVDGHLDVH